MITILTQRLCLLQSIQTTPYYQLFEVPDLINGGIRTSLRWPNTTNLRRHYNVVDSSQFRRSDVTDTTKCYIHMTSQDDESTTNCDVAATLPFCRKFVAKTSLRRSSFVVLQCHMDVTFRRVDDVAAM